MSWESTAKACLFCLKTDGWRRTFQRIAPSVLLASPTQMCLPDKHGETPRVTWGNVFDSSDPVATWRGKESVDFRRLLYENTLPVPCALCAIGHKVIC